MGFSCDLGSDCIRFWTDFGFWNDDDFLGKASLDFKKVEVAAFNSPVKKAALSKLFLSKLKLPRPPDSGRWPHKDTGRLKLLDKDGTNAELGSIELVVEWEEEPRQEQLRQLGRPCHLRPSLGSPPA